MRERSSPKGEDRLAGFGSAASRARPERRAQTQTHKLGSKMTGKQIEIDHNVLLAHMDRIKSDAGGDVARMLELLLLENYVLREQTSSGFLRNGQFDVTTYPRFVSLVEGDAADDT